MCDACFNFAGLVYITRPNSLIDTIASNNGYGRNNQWLNDTDGRTDSLPYPKSRDAIASKKYCSGNELFSTQNMKSAS